MDARAEGCGAARLHGRCACGGCWSVGPGDTHTCQTLLQNPGLQSGQALQTLCGWTLFLS